MRYFLFLDESGDHGLKTIDPNFPVIVLCGVIISYDNYIRIRDEINQLKNDIWNDKKVIFHSSDIRRCEAEFQVLFDLDIKGQFYQGINDIISNSDYTIISATIKKDEYIKKYGKSGNVYEVSLSFLLERTIFYLDTMDGQNSLTIIIEKRGRKEDTELSDHLRRVIDRGTYYVSSSRFQHYKTSFTFKDKKENINGLQLADLIAYPIARHVIDPERANIPFDLFRGKFYSDRGKTYGLKIFP